VTDADQVEHVSVVVTVPLCANAVTREAAPPMTMAPPTTMAPAAPVRSLRPKLSWRLPELCRMSPLVSIDGPPWSERSKAPNRFFLTKL
jgi:hypothetical protein